MEPELIFIAGTWKDQVFTNSDLMDAVDAYNNTRVTAPWTVGHEVNPGDPAAGWIRSLLYTESPEGVGQMWANSDFNALGQKLMADKSHGNKSVSFYAPDSISNPHPGAYFVRHVAMLGAEMPALTDLGMLGMTDFAADFDEEDVLTYSCPCSNNPEKLLPLTMSEYDKLTALIAALTAKIDNIMAEEETEELEAKAEEVEVEAKAPADAAPDYKALFEASQAQLAAAKQFSAGAGIARVVESYYSDGILAEEGLSAKDLTTCLTKLELNSTEFSESDAPTTVINALLKQLQEAKPSVSIPIGEELQAPEFKAGEGSDPDNMLGDAFYTKVETEAAKHGLSFAQALDAYLAAQTRAQGSGVNFSEAMATEANRFKIAR